MEVSSVLAEKTLLILTLAAGSVTPRPAHADVNVGIHVGVPAPPPVVVAQPPRLVAVPGSVVSYAPGVEFNLFFYDGRYWSFHHGTWFYAVPAKGKWVKVAADRVPPPVLAVPVAYYKVPPGHAKKMAGDGPPGHAGGHPGKGEGKKGKRGPER
ncbi:MAG TPA: hypothetical protein VNO23_04600 [Candidatus Binatia bacterium]|nr:hypothetical protein [Candidatus Binatia bacterium]